MKTTHRPAVTNAAIDQYNNPKQFRGFTLVELLVVIAIIGVLIGLLGPAMQNMRELSRRSVCEQNLVQLSLAMSSYSTLHGRFPAGSFNATGPIRSESKGYHHNWLSGLMPMMDATNVANAIDRTQSVYHQANAEVRGLSIPGLRCPSASGTLEYTTNYAAMTSSTETPIDENNDGVFRLNLRTREADVTAGLSYTIFIAENLSSPDEDLGWLSGTRSSLRNAGHQINAERIRIRAPGFKPAGPLYVGGIASDHVGGAYILLGGGEYQFRSETMDPQLLGQLASRSDGTIPSEWKAGLQVETATKPAATAPATTTPATTKSDAAAKPVDDAKPVGDAKTKKAAKTDETEGV